MIWEPLNCGWYLEKISRGFIKMCSKFIFKKFTREYKLLRPEVQAILNSCILSNMKLFIWFELFEQTK